LISIYYVRELPGHEAFELVRQIGSTSLDAESIAPKYPMLE